MTTFVPILNLEGVRTFLQKTCGSDAWADIKSYWSNIHLPETMNPDSCNEICSLFAAAASINPTDCSITYSHHGRISFFIGDESLTIPVSPAVSAFVFLAFNRVLICFEHATALSILGKPTGFVNEKIEFTFVEKITDAASTPGFNPKTFYKSGIQNFHRVYNESVVIKAFTGSLQPGYKAKTFGDEDALIESAIVRGFPHLNLHILINFKTMFGIEFSSLAAQKLGQEYSAYRKAAKASTSTSPVVTSPSARSPDPELDEETPGIFSSALEKAKQQMASKGYDVTKLTTPMFGEGSGIGMKTPEPKKTSGGKKERKKKNTTPEKEPESDNEPDPSDDEEEFVSTLKFTDKSSAFDPPPDRKKLTDKDLFLRFNLHGVYDEIATCFETEKYFYTRELHAELDRIAQYQGFDSVKISEIIWKKLMILTKDDESKAMGWILFGIIAVVSRGTNTRAMSRNSSPAFKKKIVAFTRALGISSKTTSLSNTDITMGRFASCFPMWICFVLGNKIGKTDVVDEENLPKKFPNCMKSGCFAAIIPKDQKYTSDLLQLHFQYQYEFNLIINRGVVKPNMVEEVRKFQLAAFNGPHIKENMRVEYMKALGLIDPTTGTLESGLEEMVKESAAKRPRPM